MKRWPTPGRIILGVLLLSAAMAALTLWPHSCLFQIPSENMVGFDEAQGLFYTTQMTGSGQKVNIYDLTTGQKQTTETLPIPVNWMGSSFHWPCVLSGDRRYLVVASEMRSQVFVFKLPTFSPVQFDIPEEARHFDTMGFSQDGGVLVLRSREMEADRIQVMNLDASTFHVSLIAYPSPFMIRGPWTNMAPQETMHLSHDHRYLATSLVGRNCVLYDLIDKKEVLRTDIDISGMARFTADGNTLVFLPGNRDDKDAIWYRLENGKWSLSTTKKLELLENELILQACDHYYVTARVELPDRAWLKHLPLWCRNKVEQLLPPSRLQLRFWDLESGHEVPALRVAIPCQGSAGHFSLSSFNLREKLIVSTDGRYLAVKDNNVIAIWETSPRRSLACWLTALCLALLAGWFVWTRRVKIASASQLEKSI